jgi:hypothetical protein
LKLRLRDRDERRVFEFAARRSDPILFRPEDARRFVPTSHAAHKRRVYLFQQGLGQRSLAERLLGDAQRRAVVADFFGIVAVGLPQILAGAGLDLKRFAHRDDRSLDL